MYKVEPRKIIMVFIPKIGLSMRFRLNILRATIILGLSTYTFADDYFDPSFLSLSGDSSQVDLSAFEKEGGVAEGNYTVSIFVNGKDVAQRNLSFEKNDNGTVVPLLTPKLLSEWGVNVSNLPEFKSLTEDKIIYNLAQFIPQSTVKLDLPRLRVDISIPQVAMDLQSAYGTNPELWEDGIPALLLNYNISAGRNRTSISNSGKSKSDNVYASARGGINLGPWRLRSTVTHTYSEDKNSSSSSRKSRRESHFSDTYLYRGINSIRSIFLAGETNTSGEIFDSIQFKGVSLQSDEQMLPSQLRGYAPAIRGIANTNARITVRQNGNVVYETYVAPGPFDINDIQQAGLSGDYDVIITEANGTERRFVVPYSALPTMLRPGGWKYEVTAGRYDGAITQGSRESNFLLGSLIYGLKNEMTLFGGAILANDYQAFNGGAGISLGSLGAISADITQSIANLRVNESGSERKNGQSYRLRYSKSLTKTGTSIDLTALRYSTEHFYNFSEFNSQGYILEEEASPWAMQRRRSSFQTQLSQRLGDYGTLRFRANRDDYWGSSKTLTGLTFGYNNTVKDISFGIDYHIDRIKDSQGKWPENRQISFNVSIPFRIFGYSEGLESIYATSAITHDNTGQTQNQIGLSGSTLESALSYSLSQSWGNQGQASVSNANVGYQGSKGIIATGYSYSNDMRSMNINASGGVLVHSSGVSLTSSMGDSVALIKAEGASGAKLMNGNTEVDGQGYAVAPYLSNYVLNSVGIDPTTLPEGVDVTHSNANLYPTKGAVVAVNIKTRIGYQVLFKITKKDKSIVPFGAIATLVADSQNDNQEINGIVGDSGQVYLSGLPEKGKLLVKWGNQVDSTCLVSFELDKFKSTSDIPIRQVTYTCEN